MWYIAPQIRTIGSVMTDQEILDLIACSKMIVRRQPAHGYRTEHRQNRCDLDLQADGGEFDGSEFKVFVRQNTEFIENFSIGLRFQTGRRQLGLITLARYNGPHGEISRDPDGHYAQPHIHRITASELAKGSLQPQENDREITDRYGTFDEGLRVFFDDTGVTNATDYFPGLLQGRLFDGH